MKIGYEDKVDLNVNTEIAEKNKVTAKNMNEIKEVVNSLDDSVANAVIDGNYVHTDNNYTSTEKSKLAGVAAKAQVNILEAIQKNGVDINIANKKANIIVPTKNGELENDSKFIMSTDFNSVSLVDEYPDQEVNGVLYLRKKKV